MSFSHRLRRVLYERCGRALARYPQPTDDNSHVRFVVRVSCHKAPPPASEASDQTLPTRNLPPVAHPTPPSLRKLRFSNPSGIGQFFGR
ncbi:hypothetical protein BD309DRAFT_972600 [Dichomitus squalens]|nr:hypothetical protein BD309DRAFT_972600 [Dichomitus squalens]